MKKGLAIAAGVTAIAAVVAAVIVSDGEPCCGNCPIEDAGQLGAIAAQYANGTPPIKTFAIYVADVASDVMTSIAHQGGTGSAYNATSGQQAFITALNDIRGSMLACEYKVPVPEAGTVNPNLVEVQFTPTGSNDPITVPRKDGVDQCGNDPGWYYDDNDAPTKVILCPGACATIGAADTGQVDLLLGCNAPPPK